MKHRRPNANGAATIRDGIKAGRSLAFRNVEYADAVFYLDWATEGRELWRRAAMRAYIQCRSVPTVWTIPLVRRGHQ
jgi:hypothetical protein